MEREKLQYQEESKIYGIHREHLSFRKVNLDLVCCFKRDMLLELLKKLTEKLSNIEYVPVFWKVSFCGVSHSIQVDR